MGDEVSVDPVDDARVDISHLEQGNVGVAGHGSVLTALSVPRFAQARKISLGAVHQAAFKTH